jgi:hypothetical protein
MSMKRQRKYFYASFAERSKQSAQDWRHELIRVIVEFLSVFVDRTKRPGAPLTSLTLQLQAY